MTLVIQGLHLKRSAAFSLDIQDLTVQPGELLCITGPNGCGKTTLMECCAGILLPDRGMVALDGKTTGTALQPVRAAMGYAPDDETWLIGELCASEYFELLEHIYRKAGSVLDLHARTVQLAKELYFSAWRHPLRSLSHGNKKKVQLIAACMHQPALLVIDELRNGLDPLAILAAESLLEALRQTGSTVVAATHDLWWAQRVASHVVILDNGKIVAAGTIQHLLGQHDSLESLFVTLTKDSYDTL